VPFFLAGGGFPRSLPFFFQVEDFSFPGAPVVFRDRNIDPLVLDCISLLSDSSSLLFARAEDTSFFPSNRMESRKNFWFHGFRFPHPPVEFSPFFCVHRSLDKTFFRRFSPFLRALGKNLAKDFHRPGVVVSQSSLFHVEDRPPFIPHTRDGLDSGSFFFF